MLMADAGCCVLAIVVSLIPGIQLPIVWPELALFALPGVVAGVFVLLRARKPQQLLTGIGAVPPNPRVALIMLAIAAGTFSWGTWPGLHPQYANGQHSYDSHGYKTCFTTARHEETVAALPRAAAALVVFFLAGMALLCLAVVDRRSEP
ncbi:hypothetical protein GCM10018954_092840 [Kutzneria kofuensis]